MSDKPVFLEDDSQLQGERLALRWIPVEQIPLLLWEDNPKSHDIGLTWESIVKNGFADPAKWDTNLTNVGGGQGALVYGNGRCEAVHHGWTQFKNGLYTGDIPRGVNTDSKGNWYIQVKFGLDAESEAAAAAFAIDHNILTLSGGDYDVAGIMAMFDEKELAKVWQKTAEQGESLLTLDGQDLAALWELLDNPDFDWGTGNDDEIGSSLNGAVPDDSPPDSSIRMVQLFLSTKTIGIFSELCNRLKDAYGTETLTDTVMEAVKREADRHA